MTVMLEQADQNARRKIMAPPEGPIHTEEFLLFSGLCGLPKVCISSWQASRRGFGSLQDVTRYGTPGRDDSGSSIVLLDGVVCQPLGTKSWAFVSFWAES